MQITLDLTIDQIAEMMFHLAKNDLRDLHLSFVTALVGGRDCYRNTSGVGPTFIPKNWTWHTEQGTLKECIDGNRTIGAIKILRGHLNLGLKEAKDLVEHIRENKNKG